jgi:hypothetical protein
LKHHEIEMKSLLNIASILAFCASAISGQAALKYRVLAITPGSAQGVNNKGDVGTYDAVVICIFHPSAFLTPTFL